MKKDKDNIRNNFITANLLEWRRKMWNIEMFFLWLIVDAGILFIDMYMIKHYLIGY